MSNLEEPCYAARMDRAGSNGKLGTIVPPLAMTMFSNVLSTLVWTTSKEAAAQRIMLTARQLLEYMEWLREVARWWRLMNRDHQHIMIMPSFFLVPEDLRSTPCRCILSYVKKMDEIEQKTNRRQCLYVLAGCYSKQ